MLRNPKQADSSLFDCIPQAGPCPNNCNQCFYNRPEAFYLPINTGHYPTLDEVGDGIVRVNSGHDSNINRPFVIKSTEHFPKRFFNTSIPSFDFPAPVVFTANAQEEKLPYLPSSIVRDDYEKIMFVRLRVSSTNLLHILNAATEWSRAGVPVVLTFMRYYDAPPDNDNYEYRKSIKNDYWCPKKRFMAKVMQVAIRLVAGATITMCGTLNSSYCRDCLNCERFYYRAIGAANQES